MLSAQSETPQSRRVEPLAESGLRVVIDFDSVIARHDVGEHLLTRFAGDAWWELSDSYDRGAMSSLEATNALFAHIADVPQAALQAAACEVGIVSDAADAVGRLASSGVEVVIVSDGFGFYVPDAVAGWPVRIVCNDVDWAGRAMLFPHRGSGCSCQSCGSCAQAPVKVARRQGCRTAVVSGSLADRKAILVGDVAFARSRLASWCSDHGVAYVPFENLTSVADTLLGPDDRPDVIDMSMARRDDV
ncbi:MAG: hypothetical protein KDB86_11880 [Actinobacteria bacterium]|nr:hypothetical protein [Actinomycetota bacterium]MCB9389277.1 hypothetical protein [Acidimicrobiia bacterium]